MLRAKQTEKDVQKAISDYLTANKIVHWRQNSGAVMEEYAGKKRFFKFMAWLYPTEIWGHKLVFLDIGGIMPDGRYFTVEIKAPGKKPGTEQDNTLSYIYRRTNAISLWADSLDMFIQKYNSIPLQEHFSPEIYKKNND